MSIIRIAARMAAIEALRGRTIVGENVLDSEIGSIDVDADGNLRTQEDKPFITVYTDAANAEGANLRSLVVNGLTDFIFEAGITAAMVETDQDTGASTIHPGIPATDRAMEFFLDIVVRQIGDALTDPANEWAQIFLKLATGFQSVKRARTSSQNTGVRLAGQQVAIRAELLNDPVRGMTLAPTHALSMFFAKAATLTDTALQAQIALMQAQIGGNASGFVAQQQWFGRTAAEMAAGGDQVVGEPITKTVLSE